MPAKELKELRHAGKLEEALNLAKAELQMDPDNIWTKRNLGWVYYDYLKQSNSPELFHTFFYWLNEIPNLNLPKEEKMLFEQLSWQVGKMVFGLLKSNPYDNQKSLNLLEIIQYFHFPKPSEGYSFLFKALHKAFKNTDKYLSFADWWGFQNFMPLDFQKEKMPNGKEVMSIAEQAYITYAKQLLPKQISSTETTFNKEKALTFLPILSDIVTKYPEFLYPAYFNAKLLLVLGDKDNLFKSLLPFARKKRNEFWVWEILAEVHSNDPDKVFACYCKALSCKSPGEMLVKLRQKMAAILISRKNYTEAKTEIELLVNARNTHGFRLPIEIVNWQSQDWYKNTDSNKTNYGFYENHLAIAESILFSDSPEETVIVEFVNSDKKILHFITSESKMGFFKYGRFLREVKIGDILKIRFQRGNKGGAYFVYTVIKTTDEGFKKQFVKDVEGFVKIIDDKPFGFLEDVFIHPSLVSRMKLANGTYVKGTAILSYNPEKKQWGWKLI